MAFDVQLGVSNDPKNKISKTISNVASYPCTVRQDSGIDVFKPSVILQGGNDVVGKNYAYIPDFGRYYHVVKMSAINGGRWQIDMAEDVLMSYRSSILQSDVILNRSADYRNYFLRDTQLPVTDRTLTWTRTFPNSPFDGTVDGAIVTILGTND